MIDLQLFAEEEEENTVIIVEGVSDLIFLSLLLDKWNGYKYDVEIPVPNMTKGMKCSRYIKGESKLVIFAVGGIDHFARGFSLVRNLIVSKNTKRVVLIADSDERTKKETLDKINVLNESITSDKWIKTTLLDDFDSNIDIDFYYKLIPDDNSGALENLVIDVLEKDEPEITNKSVEFVDELTDVEAKYINKKRMRLKAKTSVIFSLMSPDCTLDVLRSKFEMINYNNPVIVSNFGFLKDV